MWHMIQRLPGYMPQPFIDAAMELNKVELGVTTTSPRWQRCVAKAESAFGFVSAALYVDKTFPPESKSRVRRLHLSHGSQYHQLSKVAFLNFFFKPWSVLGYTVFISYIAIH